MSLIGRWAIRWIRVRVLEEPRLIFQVEAREALDRGVWSKWWRVICNYGQREETVWTAGLSSFKRLWSSQGYYSRFRLRGNHDASTWIQASRSTLAQCLDEVCGCAVVLWIACWTANREVRGSNPGYGLSCLWRFGVEMWSEEMRCFNVKDANMGYHQGWK